MRELCGRLLATKVMTGAGGLELTAEIQVAIAAQACLPILKLGIEWYRGWSGIVVYPSEYVAPRRVQDEAGLVHEFDETAAGEAWDGGPVIVSWAQDTDEAAGGNQAYNVVIHEFAHKLDLLAGGACTVKAEAPWIKTPQTARFIDSGTLVINNANLTSYKDDLKKVTGDIQSKFKATYLNCK